MSEQQKKMIEANTRRLMAEIEANTRLMAEMDVEALEKVNALLTGVTRAVKARKPAKAAQTDAAKADERKEG